MTGREQWDFLDEFNGNFLYKFVSNKHLTFTDSKEIYYYLWFFYRYVLECKTYEEALQYTDIASIKKYNLVRFFYKKNDSKGQKILTIGDEAFGELMLCALNVTQIDLIVASLQATLEILYGRYNYLEQIDCYISHQPSLKTKKHKNVLAAEEIMKKSLDYFRKRPQKYAEMLAEHQASRKGILKEKYYEI